MPPLESASMSGRTEVHPDADWIASIKAGSADATSRLRQIVRRRLGVTLAAQLGVTDADLDDFTQEACLRILGTIDSFRGEARFATWATTVAVRVALTALRRRRWSREQVTQQLEESLHASATTAHADHSAEADELLAALRDAIDGRLTTRQRQVIVGELSGIPQVLIAEHLGSTPNAVYKVSHDARRKLRDALEESGFDAEATRSILDGASREVR